jgi:diketogulonate reductase-like aldo/keto reductase
LGTGLKAASYHFTSPSPIPKSVNPDRLKENFAALEKNLDPATMAALVTLDCRYR